MKTQRKKQAPTTSQKSECIGVPVLCSSVGGIVLVSVKEFFALQQKIAALSKVLGKIGVGISEPTHVADGHLFFPNCTFAQGDPKGDDEEPVERVDLKTRLVALASPVQTAVSFTRSPAVQRSTTPTPQPRLGVDAMGMNDKDPAKLIRKGPCTLQIGGQTVPYARAFPPPKPLPNPPVRLALIDPVGNDVHLLDSERNRLRVEQPTQLANVGPGSVVTAEHCRLEKILFAGPDAFCVQFQLDLGEED